MVGKRSAQRGLFETDDHGAEGGPGPGGEGRALNKGGELMLKGIKLELTGIHKGGE